MPFTPKEWLAPTQGWGSRRVRKGLCHEQSDPATIMDAVAAFYRHDLRGQAGRRDPGLRATDRAGLTACHIGGFGPQLTPLGRAFKIGGYTQGGGSGLAASIPLSLMIQTSFNNTGADQNPPPQHYGPNNNFSLDQISGFIGGGIGDHVGGFMQFTWTDVDNTAHVDNVDLRP